MHPTFNVLYFRCVAIYLKASLPNTKVWYQTFKFHAISSIQTQLTTDNVMIDSVKGYLKSIKMAPEKIPIRCNSQNLDTIKM